MYFHLYMTESSVALTPSLWWIRMTCRRKPGTGLLTLQHPYIDPFHTHTKKRCWPSHTYHLLNRAIYHVILLNNVANQSILYVRQQEISLLTKKQYCPYPIYSEVTGLPLCFQTSREVNLNTNIPGRDNYSIDEVSFCVQEWGNEQEKLATLVEWGVGMLSGAAHSLWLSLRKVTFLVIFLWKKTNKHVWLSYLLLKNESSSSSSSDVM